MQRFPCILGCSGKAVCSNFRGDVFARSSAALLLVNCAAICRVRSRPLFPQLLENTASESTFPALLHTNWAFPTPGGDESAKCADTIELRCDSRRYGQRLMFICNTTQRKQLRSGRGSIFLSAWYVSSSATFTAASTFCMLAWERAPNGG